MINRALDSNNDLIVTNGSLVVVDEGAAIVQDVRCRLLLYKAEWFLDIEVGTAWFDIVFVKPVDLDAVESMLKSVIITTDGVEKLVSFSMQFDSTTRNLSVEFSAETTFGIITGATINV